MRDGGSTASPPTGVKQQSCLTSLEKASRWLNEQVNELSSAVRGHRYEDSHVSQVTPVSMTKNSTASCPQCAPALATHTDEESDRKVLDVCLFTNLTFVSLGLLVSLFELELVLLESWVPLPLSWAR